MQEIKKRRIVLASLLKPVDDSRMFEKFGVTLASGYEVHVIGQRTENPVAATSVKQHPLPVMHRLSLRRLLVPFRILGLILDIKPALLIVTTPELLAIALCARMFTGTCVVYDVQENYAQNILHGSAWPAMLRPLFAVGVRTVEYASRLFVRHYILAEAEYADLRFARSCATLIENKVIQDTAQHHSTSHPVNRNGTLHLVFSGTLADTTGVWDAINVARQLSQAGQQLKLTIIGYATKTLLQQQLRDCARDHTFIALIGIDKLVPHREILSTISHADFGVVSYPPNRSTWQSLPTKVFEYLGYRLPMLLIDNPKWIRYCEPYSAAVVFSRDASKRDISALREQMHTQTFYTAPPLDVYWSTEAPRLLACINNCLDRGRYRS